jgi:hypothetical protein
MAWSQGHITLHRKLGGLQDRSDDFWVMMHAERGGSWLRRVVKIISSIVHEVFVNITVHSALHISIHSTFNESFVKVVIVLRFIIISVHIFRDCIE